MKFFLIGGLADSEESFRPWKEVLQTKQQTVQYINVQPIGNQGFGRRLNTLLHEVSQSSKKVCIIGQSAGGLAALIAANNYPEKVAGIIAVSPAMPKGISPIGWPLRRVMWRYYYNMFKSHLIYVSTKDYATLALGGVADPEKLLKHRDVISGREAYELATPELQPELGDIEIPVVHIYGGKDNWVKPSAQEKLLNQLDPYKTASIFLPNAGHLPVHTKDGAQTVQEALEKLASMIARAGT